jgi:hypothetical protein
MGVFLPPFVSAKVGRNTRPFIPTLANFIRGRRLKFFNRLVQSAKTSRARAFGTRWAVKGVNMPFILLKHHVGQKVFAEMGIPQSGKWTCCWLLR